ncbi:MAG: hypothetical protein KDB69_05180, partial [Acidimicrobiia bacterium]|nr:hypothetical protein [Acidimicrobiia bacterium]
MKKMTKSLRVAVLLLVLALVAAACSSDDSTDTTSGSGGDGETYTIGVSNNVVGNSWREQMICAIKAEARVRGN